MKNEITHNEIRGLCGAALESVRDALPTGMHQEAHDMIYIHGEWGVAMEFVIDWIGDLELRVNQSQLKAFEQAMNAMGWSNAGRMQWLRSHTSK